MTRTRKILLLSACGLIAVVAVCFFCLREKEPSYHGRKLSEWLDRTVLISTNIAYSSYDVNEAIDAIGAIGTNAAPLFVKWLVAKDSAPIRFLSRHRTIPGADRLVELAERDSRRGWICLSVLGTKALPYLRTQVDSADPNIRANASRVIDFIKAIKAQQPRIWAGPD
ncbi:MAG: domain containing protein [Verrucomicrobiales bacterium]|nr:domain containing protein [Verrucomicrobiales bacterium]